MISAENDPDVGPVAGATAKKLRIGLHVPYAANDVTLRIMEPSGPVLGTVITAMGGTGTDYFTTYGTAQVIVNSLLAYGFRVIDRKWAGEGWFGVSAPFEISHERCVLMFRWVRSNYAGRLIVLGQSGGAEEVARYLAHYDGGDVLDRAVMSCGPVMAHLQYACGVAPPEWVDQHKKLVPPGLSIDLMHASGGTLCPIMPVGASRGTLVRSSLLYSGVTLRYPKTFVHFVFGRDDTTAAHAHGIKFARSVESRKTIEWAPGSHLLYESAAGRAAMLAAVVAGLKQPAV